MTELDLEVVDGLELSEDHRKMLRPGEAVQDEHGNSHRLPRFYFAVPSWKRANEIRLAPHFTLAELMKVDCREADLLLNRFPHYVPCAVVLIARYLEDLRRDADAAIVVGANGGYRSPAHQRNEPKSPHCWATAADIYRVGGSYLDDERSITRYGDMARALGPQVFARPYTQGDDHLHIDLGFINVTPRNCSET
jgi:hypothetical protein